MHQTEYIINTIMMITNLGQWIFIKRLFTRYSRSKKLTTKNPKQNICVYQGTIVMTLAYKLGHVYLKNLHIYLYITYKYLGVNINSKYNVHEEIKE